MFALKTLERFKGSPFPARDVLQSFMWADLASLVPIPPHVVSRLPEPHTNVGHGHRDVVYLQVRVRSEYRNKHGVSPLEARHERCSSRKARIKRIRHLQPPYSGAL